MLLQAILTEAELARAMKQFLPVKIYLHHEGDEARTDRWLQLGSPIKVALVPGKGFEMSCAAEIVWGVAGLRPTVKIDELRVRVRPEVKESKLHQKLEFHIEVEEADFHNLPKIIDEPIVEIVNAALATKKIPLDMSETLARKIPLGGKMFDPVEGLSIKLDWAKSTLDATALTLVLALDVEFVRGDAS